MKIYPENTDLSVFAAAQLSSWRLARDNYRALKSVRTKRLKIRGLDALLQYNPARITSSSAKIDSESLASRECFLCREHRVDQSYIPFHGRKGKDYDILLNPYPIFRWHFTVPLTFHTPQSIWRRYTDMLSLAERYPSYTIIYNGPQCGASAPDHHHFQAVPGGSLPMETAAMRAFSGDGADGADGTDGVLRPLTSFGKASIFLMNLMTTGVFVISSSSSKDAAKLFYRLLDCVPDDPGLAEPMINLLSFSRDGIFYSIVFLRKKHRSHHYYAQGEENIFMSLGSVDMGGVFIAALEKDFEKVTSKDIEDILDEISIDSDFQEKLISRICREQPEIEVGIMSAPQIRFRLLYDGDGVKTVSARDGRLLYDSAVYDELYFDSPTRSTFFAEPAFELSDVTIGKGFHWERKECQVFAGALKLIAEGDLVTAVNVIGIEDYLLSVISSEMKSSAPTEFLKAHAVISRSWALLKIRNRGAAAVPVREKVSEGEIIRWYDGDGHERFDVCADDHCQRYQGLTRAVGHRIKEAIDETWGEVLSYEGKVCDARFSKCCGGKTEIFSTCWDDTDYPYLVSKDDPYCGRAVPGLLRTVLNDYDMETESFYRWKAGYGTEELSALVRERTGIDFGTVISMIPVLRGPSGRIVKLEIAGTKKKMVFGKELEIRRILSRSHLYSSAFDIKSGNGRFVLEGKGWGHGVGLCQIGAAVMAAEGAGYKEIVDFYYPGTFIIFAEP